MAELWRIFDAGRPAEAREATERFLRRLHADPKAVASVRQIVEDVRREGDVALIRYTAMFDGVNLAAEGIRVQEDEVREAVAQVDEAILSVLRLARDRITYFHRQQVRQSWFMVEEDGTLLGQKIGPLRRVGVYVPGGSAAYPSSVLMNVLPAVVAGVDEICLVTPPGRDGKVNPHILAAAQVAGVKEVYRVGGAQAVAAMAYGTGVMPRVDKIVGPGNIYVTLAKKMVYGDVGIDTVAGPSEIVVVADNSADPVLAAADLLSQAEHDPLAAAILVTDSLDLARRVGQELVRQMALLKRKEVAQASMEHCGGCVLVGNMAGAVEWANRIAPEHLELLVKDPAALLGQVRHVGAVFLGPDSPEPVGDYLAGTNHVLPTHGAARYSSGLGVDDFIKKSSIVSFAPAALRRLGPAIIDFATVEGLTAHANAVRVRLERGGGHD